LSEIQPQAGNPTGDPASPSVTPPPAAVPTSDPASPSRAAADYEREIRELRTEAAKYRTENKDLKSFKEQQEALTLSETEKLQKAAKEAADLAAAREAELKDTKLRIEIERQARKLGIVDEDAAYRLMDTGKVEYSEDGKAKNVDALLGDLVKSKPYLVGATGGDSATNAARSRGGKYSLQAIRTMSKEEILADYDNVRASLKAASSR
jgi:hypothetical protein